MRGAVLAVCLVAFPDPLTSLIREWAPPGVTILRVDRTGAGARVIGSAPRPEDVTALMKTLATFVQTKQGVRRVVERQAGMVRVAVPGADAGTLADVPEKDAVPWDVTLVRADPIKKGKGVAFDVRMAVK